MFCSIFFRTNKKKIEKVPTVRTYGNELFPFDIREFSSDRNKKKLAG